MEKNFRTQQLICTALHSFGGGDVKFVFIHIFFNLTPGISLAKVI